MARILYTWELGGGLGHIVPYIPIMKHLRERGHEVLCAIKDVKNAESTLGRHGISYIQAPAFYGKTGNWVEHPHIFAQILNNVGYGSGELLTGLAKAWRQLVELYRPELIMYNHSPTALLATRHIGCRKVIIGTGFHMPPDHEKLLILRQEPKPDIAQLESDNARILDHINGVLKVMGSRPLERVTQLYQADQKVVLSFSEMDHYFGREDGGIDYWGIGSSDSGHEPVWPAGTGKRVFAYLKPFRTLPELLATLLKLRTPALIYAPEVAAELKAKYSGRTISFSDKPLNMGQVSSQCDVAITNATHATSTSVLLSGKPQLLLPLQLEQLMVAHNVERLGAGLAAPLLHPQMMEKKLLALLQEDRFTSAAESYREKYSTHNSVDMELRLATHIDSLLQEG